MSREARTRRRLGIDVEAGGQPAGLRSRTKPQGQDEKAGPAVEERQEDDQEDVGQEGGQKKGGRGGGGGRHGVVTSPAGALAH